MSKTKKLFRNFVYSGTLVMSLGARIVYSSDVKIIVNSENKMALTKQVVYDIYYGDLTHWPASKNRILPSKTSNSTPADSAMIVEIMDIEPDAFSSHWRRKLFSGMGIPPREFDSPQKVLEFVASNKNAIGIVPSLPSVPSTVTVVAFSQLKKNDKDQSVFVKEQAAPVRDPKSSN